MTPTKTVSSRRSYSSLFPLGGACSVLVLGYLPTRSIAGGNGIQAMVLAVGLILFVVYATMLPAMRMMVNAAAANRFQIALAVGGIRFLVTLLLVAAVAWQGLVNTTIFLIWSAMAYFVMIMLETITLILWNRRLEARTC